MTEIETQKSDTEVDKKKMTNKKILGFSLEFGFMIAIPLVVLSLVGKALANHYHNQGFLYGGLVLALIVSITWFYKRITDIYNDFIN